MNEKYVHYTAGLTDEEKNHNVLFTMSWNIGKEELATW
jgi:hypothetical protein